MSRKKKAQTEQMGDQPVRKKKKISKVRRIAEDVIMVALVGIIALSGWKIYSIYHDYNTNQGIYDNITETAQADGWTGDIDFDALRAINPDIKAWLYYEGTHIDYPVVQGTDNEKYLKTMFDGTYSGFGTLFVDASTRDAFNQFNTIIYGHHMLNGSMFGDLKELKDQSYAEEHPQLELITPDGKYHLMITAFLNEPSDSNIYTMNIEEENDKQNYIDMIESQAMYLTDETMTTDDQLVILSTCAYEYQNARYMVVCKMVPWENQ